MRVRHRPNLAPARIPPPVVVESLHERNGGDSILTGSMKRLDGSDQDLSEFEGDVVLVVNTASKCGLTPQYEGLQRLYDEKNDAGFTVLASPPTTSSSRSCSEDEIAEFCQVNYGVSFRMFAKTSVKATMSTRCSRP